MYQIIPGILEKEWNEIERKIELVKPFVKTVHIDIIDGKLVNNTTFLDPKPFSKYSSDLFLEVHMMVEEPINFLRPFADAGFKRFLGHVEKMSDQTQFVAQGQLLGEVGLAIDGPTSLDLIKVPFEDLDTILIYTCEKMGFSGPKFMQERLEKVKEITKRNPLNNKGESFPIEVDGGMNEETIVLAKEAGASRFACTSCLFNSENPQEQYKKIAEIVGILNSYYYK